MTVYAKCPDCQSYTAVEADNQTWTRCTCGSVEYQYPAQTEPAILNIRRVPQRHPALAEAAAPSPYRCATCRAPVDPNRPERFFQVFICTKTLDGRERADEQFFCSAPCLAHADFLVHPPQAPPAALAALEARVARLERGA